MENNLVSVIVPIYKVEKYLKRCIDSLLNQIYQNIEIILVDDGSPDHCPQICEEYKSKDNRIKVIHKKNGGLSDARNVGIEFAQGRYLSFVDSDDYVSPGFIDRLVSVIEKNNADIAVCDFLITEKSNEADSGTGACETCIYNGKKEIMNNFYNKNCDRHVIACNKLYKKELFEGIRYPKGRIYEDEATTYKIFYQASRTVFINEKLYFYFQRKDSITGQKITLKNLDAFISLDEVVQFYHEKEDKYYEIRAQKRFFKSLISCYLGLDKKSMVYKEISNRIYELLILKLREYKFYRNIPYLTLYTGYKIIKMDIIRR